jgi:hypothetical protein
MAIADRSGSEPTAPERPPGSVIVVGIDNGEHRGGLCDS